MNNTTVSIDRFLISIDKSLGLSSSVVDQCATRLAELQIKLFEKNSNLLTKLTPYGAYTRETLLPVSHDRKATIGVLAVFTDPHHPSTTYVELIDRMLSHAFPGKPRTRNATSIVLHAHPLPIRIVPALDSGTQNYRIPAINTVSGWRHIDPTEFQRRLDFADQFNQQLIRPLVRIIKYWNAINGYPFHPFHLEYEIIDKGYQYLGGSLSVPRLFDYVFEFLTHCRLEQFNQPRKQRLLNRTKVLLKRSQRLDAGGRHLAAMRCIAEMLPMTDLIPSGLARRRWLVI